MSKWKIQQKTIEKRKRYKDNRKQRITDIKNNLPDGNAINLPTMSLTTAQKSLLKKGPSFVPTSSNVNWLTLWKDFGKFDNQLKYQLKHTNQQSSTLRNELQPYHSSKDADVLEPNTNTHEQLPPPPPKEVDNNTPMYRSKETYNRSLEIFIRKVKKELFDPENVKNARQNLTRDERNALAEI